MTSEHVRRRRTLGGLTRRAAGSATTGTTYEQSRALGAEITVQGKGLPRNAVPTSRARPSASVAAGGRPFVRRH